MKNDISVSIGCRIKYVRNCLNLTQVQFSKTLGVTSSHISRLEHGIGNISTALARSISKIYAVNEEWLLTGEGEMKDSQYIAERPAESDQEIIEELININDRISILISKMRIDRANSQPSEDE